MHCPENRSNVELIGLRLRIHRRRPVSRQVRTVSFGVRSRYRVVTKSPEATARRWRVRPNGVALLPKSWRALSLNEKVRHRAITPENVPHPHTAESSSEMVHTPQKPATDSWHPSEGGWVVRALFYRYASAARPSNIFFRTARRSNRQARVHAVQP